jgi:hypothetical protein
MTGNEINNTCRLSEDPRNEPAIWVESANRLLRALNVLRRGAEASEAAEQFDAELTAMMLAGFAFENAFKAHYLRTGGTLYHNKRLQILKGHTFSKWVEAQNVGISQWEAEALDKAEFICVAWGRYPCHNKIEHERKFETWSWSDVDRIRDLALRLIAPSTPEKGII